MRRVKAFLNHKPVIILWVFLAVLVCVGIINAVIIAQTGTPVAVPVTPRGAEKYGNGKPLTYVVMGDSTTVAQGGNYHKGYARTSARHLAKQGYGVTFYNLGVSGARSNDAAKSQTPEAAALKPDLVLIAVGANDVTHLTSVSSVKKSLSASIMDLRAANPGVRIVLTGSPDMGTVPRFPQPTRYLAGVQTDRLNRMVIALATDKKVTLAPIASETGPVFAAHPEYYAPDKFHPNDQGYAVWVPVINRALDQALAK